MGDEKTQEHVLYSVYTHFAGESRFWMIRDYWIISLYFRSLYIVDTFFNMIQASLGSL